jgi:hypothetical protein
MQHRAAQAIENALVHHYNIYPEAKVYKIEADFIRESEFAILIHAAHFNVPLRYNVTL